MKTTLPKALKPGDTIGIMAPSSAVEQKKFDQAVETLSKRGFTVVVHRQTYFKRKQLAGTGKQKADAFHDLLKNKAIKAIFFAKGGNGAGEMLEYVDFSLVSKHPKILLGYSDISALLNPIYKKTGLVGFHGPMLRQQAKGTPRAQIQQCFDLLAGKKKQTIPFNKASVIKSGRAKGRLVGGNVCILASLMGTPFQPDFKGAILFLEDISEEYSNLHRMLIQLRNAGAFREAAGVVFGSFTDMKDEGHTPYGFKLSEIIRDVTRDLDIPIVMNAPFGHGKDLYTFPIGLKATLTVAARGKSRLTLDGPAVRG